MGCYFLLQGIFATWGSNPPFLYLLHCEQILYSLSHLLRPVNIKMHILKIAYMSVSCSCENGNKKVKNILNQY